MNTPSTCIKEECKTVIETILEYYKEALSREKIIEILNEHYHISVVNNSIDELLNDNTAQKNLGGNLTDKSNKAKVPPNNNKNLKDLLKNKIKENLDNLKGDERKINTTKAKSIADKLYN